MFFMLQCLISEAGTWFCFCSFVRAIYNRCVKMIVFYVFLFTVFALGTRQERGGSMLFLRSCYIQSLRCTDMLVI